MTSRFCAFITSAIFSIKRMVEKHQRAFFRKHRSAFCCLTHWKSRTNRKTLPKRQCLSSHSNYPLVKIIRFELQKEAVNMALKSCHHTNGQCVGCILHLHLFYIILNNNHIIPFLAFSTLFLNNNNSLFSHKLHRSSASHIQHNNHHMHK